MSVAGKLVLVIGGGSGIGRETCKAYHREGATVIAADINLAGAQETIQGFSDHEKHASYKVDVTSSAAVDALAAQIVEKFGAPPSIVVHTVGAIVYKGGLFNCRNEDWDKSIGLNLSGTFYVLRTFVTLMKENGIHGAAVTFSSIAAGGSAFIPEYSAAKAGVEGLTKAVGKEVAELGIRVNCISPGITDTPLAVDLGAEHVKRSIQAVPMKRLGQPKELAELALFLGSDKASFQTASVVLCSGGFIR